MTSKLETRSEKLYFIGYPKETKGYYFYHDQDHTIVVSRNAKFLENEYILSDLEKDKVDFDEGQNAQNNLEARELEESDTLGMNIPYGMGAHAS